MRGGWEQTTVDMPTLESYQTANISTANTSSSEGSAPVAENEILFKRVVSLSKWLSFSFLFLKKKTEICKKMKDEIPVGYTWTLQKLVMIYPNRLISLYLI